MTRRPVPTILATLEAITGHKPTHNGHGWQGRCPAHDDRRPSLSIAEGDDGRALIRCHAGCATETVVLALGLTMRDLMPADIADTETGRMDWPEGGIPSASALSKRPKRYVSAREAVAELERRHGPRSATWTYENAEGEPVGVIVRWDRSGGKDILPVSRNGTTWRIGGMPVPRPLYCLPELAAAKRVYITEGEKAADALRSVGLVATTSPHGSTSATKADWSPLAGKDPVILPDNNDAGRGYGDDVAAILAKLTPTPSVKLVALPDLPSGGDAADYVEARRAAGLDDDAIHAEIEALTDSIRRIELDRPKPNIDGFARFPVQVLPEPVRSFVANGARAMGCDASYVALPMLSALAGAIGNTRRIQLKRGWAEPAIIWTAIVGESGTLKTPAFKLVIRPIRDRQNDALKRHAKEHAELTGDLSAAWSKLEGYAARLALVVHLARWAANDPTLADPDHVDESSVSVGVVLSRWFGREARRVYCALGESDDGRDRHRLVELIQRKGGSVSVRDWQRARSHKTTGDAEAELNELVETSFGRWEVPPQTGRGRPTKRFVLPLDCTDNDKNPCEGPETAITSVSDLSDGPGGTLKADGKRKERSTGTTDRAAAERILAKRIADAALRKDGVVDARADLYAAAERHMLSEHVADWKVALTAKRVTRKQVALLLTRVETLLRAVKAERLRDLTASAVQTAIGELHDNGKSLQTCQHYLRAIKQFSSWLRRDGRIRDDVLAHLTGYNASTDRRYERRPLTAEELKWLIDVAEHNSAWHGMTGLDRAVLYRVATGTGFRASELRSLTSASFHLDAHPPTIMLLAKSSKRRRDDVQPIRSDLDLFQSK